MAKTKKKQTAKHAAHSKSSQNPNGKCDEAMDTVESRVKNSADDSDARSVVTNKMLKDLHLTKKAKRKVKHTLWKKRVNAAIDVRQTAAAAKAKKRKNIDSVVGDMSAMLESLPFEELINKMSSKVSSKGTSQQNARSKSVKKESVRQQEKLSDISLFRSILFHPLFKSNPIQTVTEHLQKQLDNANN